MKTNNEKWAIVYKATDRYYIGETWSRLHEDFLPEWSNPGETKDAATFASKERAEDYLKHILLYRGLGCEAVKIA